MHVETVEWRSVRCLSVRHGVNEIHDSRRTKGSSSSGHHGRRCSHTVIHCWCFPRSDATVNRWAPFVQSMGLGSPDRATINVRIRIKVGTDFATDFGIEVCTHGFYLWFKKGECIGYLQCRGTCAPHGKPFHARFSTYRITILPTEGHRQQWWRQSMHITTVLCY